jgi:hypothetical protein
MMIYLAVWALFTKLGRATTGKHNYGQLSVWLLVPELHLGVVITMATVFTILSMWVEPIDEMLKLGRQWKYALQRNDRI